MTRTLLIVEDDDDISESLYDVFEDQGYLVWRAGNGREAIDIVTREALRPDVILLDLRMPVMDGNEFLRARRDVPPLAEARVIVMTAQPERLDETGDVFARLAKPIPIADLIGEVERACHAPAM